MSNLQSLGWSERLAAEANLGVGEIPARVAAEHRGEYSVIDQGGQPYRAVLSGRLLGDGDPSSRPAVGDWVAVRRDPGGTSVIVRRFARSTELVRKAAGRTSAPQVIAANLDVVFVVTWPGGDFNVRRVERYLTVVWEGGAQPVIVLSKADLCDDPGRYLDALGGIALGVPVELVSGLRGDGLDRLRAHLGAGRTGALVGSSGVGKSTLVNALIGSGLQKTGAVREADAKGRHVTTHRELFVTEWGVLIDTPGMRELGLWGGDEGVALTYTDIEELAESCRFRDCAHDTEPGCAVREAMEDGELAAERLESYRKQERELAYMARQRDAAYRRELRQRGKARAREIKLRQRLKGK